MAPVPNNPQQTNPDVGMCAPVSCKETQQFHGKVTCSAAIAPRSIEAVMFRRLVNWLRDTSSGPSNTVGELLHNEEGAIFVEYLTLTLMVSVTCAMATLTLGEQLLRLYRFQQIIVTVPIP